MTVAEPAFVAPRSLEEALEACAEPGALALAGGTALALLVRRRLVEPAALVSLGNVPELQWIRTGPDALHVGAGATYRQLARSAEVAAVAPGLGALAGRIANPRVRAVATVGGALAHADPRQDLAPVLLALGATARLASARGTRTVPLAGFASGLMETVLADGELVVEVTVPGVAGRTMAYERFTPASGDDFPTVAVAAAATRDAAGALRDLAVAVGAAGPAPYLVPGLDALVARGEPDAPVLEAMAEAAAAAATPVPDRLGSSAYKVEMVRVHALRALRRALVQG